MPFGILLALLAAILLAAISLFLLWWLGWTACRGWLGWGLEHLQRSYRRLGVWVLAVTFTIGVPCLPIGVEALQRDGAVREETYLLTAAVLAGTFGATSESNMNRVAYGGLFLYTLLLDTVSSDTTRTLAHWAGTLLGIVALLHGAERCYWHVALDRPFPDGSGAKK